MANPPIITQDPKINTTFGPADNGCGEVVWEVEFELPRPAQADGWIIQSVSRFYDIKDAQGHVYQPALQGQHPTFWEAWLVQSGKRHTFTRYKLQPNGRTFDESFDQPNRGLYKGEWRVRARAKFFQVALPSDFRQNNPDTPAGGLFSTTRRPPFWDDTGTPHNLTATWNCVFGSLARKIPTKTTIQRTPP
jgi:hypothetical protein